MYDGGVRSSSERRRLRDAGRYDAVQRERDRRVGVIKSKSDIRAEEVASVSGEVVVDGETRLRVE